MRSTLLPFWQRNQPAQPAVTQPAPLVIPLESGYAVIPLGVTRDDFECLKQTLELWEKRIVKADPVDDYTI